ncbi:MAG: rod shape-determining protein RodA [Candidatus Pelagibacterales bacterium]|nr:MAG: rod shape-determining protein RodA [Pelagibacterales bacterium]
MIKTHFKRDNHSLRDKILALDFLLIFSILLLGIISLFAMYSTEQGKLGYYTKSHLYRFFTFFILFIIISFFRIQVWFKSAYFFYFLVLALLFAVDLFGVTASGSKRWISLFFINLQPSELMKIALIIFLARFYYKIPTENLTNLKNIIVPFFAVFVPVLLVGAQPDLGTALLILIGGITVIWLTGLKLKIFLYSFLFGICLLPVGISFLKPYQKSRILTFLEPERDALGAGYQIIQSKIALGSGGIFGKGFLQGSQSYLDYLPEKHTDFIFTLFSEEFGFIGSLTLLLIYVLIIYRITAIGQNSRNNFAKLYCFGFAAAFFVYVAVNMSMVLGLLPIVGAPLPIMSYGGSSMLAVMIGLGIVMSCKIYQEDDIN